MVDLVLEAHHYPAVVIDSRWNLVAANSAAAVLTAGIAEHLLQPPVNLIRLTLHPEGLAPRMLHLHKYGGHIIGRLRRLVAHHPHPELLALVDEFAHLAATGPATALSSSSMVLPLVVRFDDGDVRMFSTVTTFGTPREITLSELAIETLYPADAASRAVLDQAIARLPTMTSLTSSASLASLASGRR